MRPVPNLREGPVTVVSRESGPGTQLASVRASEMPLRERKRKSKAKKEKKEW